MRWTEEEISILSQYYPSKGLKWTAKQLGRSEASIRQKASKLGVKQDINSKFFKDWQNRAKNSKIGKKRPEQAEVMKNLHRTGKLIQGVESRVRQGKTLKKHIKKYGHPKGMLGKKHSQKTKDLFSEQRRGRKHNLSKEERQNRSDRASQMIHNRLQNKGTIYSRSKNGWYKINNRKYYFRSGWEVNYARYLEWLKQEKQIKRWQYEPKTFWFENIKRGVRSYTPDFRIENNDGSIEYHEVKGYMDAKSKTKIKRMAKYYPNTVLIVIEKLDYTSIMKFDRIYPESITL